MQRFIRTALLASGLAFISANAMAAESLPLRRVVVTASGLALYEHAGTVAGDAEVTVPVRLDSVDDMLKSLVVLDARGTLGGVSLPGREPLSQTFRGLPFSEDDLGSLVQLLNALRGAEVQTETMSGRLMNVVQETEQSEDGLIIRHRISILTAEGIKTAVLENLNSLKFTDPAVQSQIDRALEATFTNRIKDQRTLTVSLKGTEERPVALAYIQDAPLWKSSYRLVLPHETDTDAKAVLQGWAVLENTTGIDWNDVSVTLMSGSPVTYRQSLYESYYLPRPELPVKVMDRVLPRTDQGTVASVEEKAASGAMNYQGDTRQRFGKADYAQESMPMAAPQEMMAMDMVATAEMAMPARGHAGGYAPQPQSPPPPMATIMTAAADETASQLVFAFPESVDLPAGNTLMVPFVSRALPAQKLWVYQPETNPNHPLAAIDLENAAESGLPPGILTLYDRSDTGLLHVGDADMPLVPKGEKRFISFALDTKTKIDQQVQDDRRLGLIKIAKGVLTQKILWQNTTTYTIKPPEDEARTIVIEHPRREGWTLLPGEGWDGEPENTATHHRLRVTLKGGESKTVKATLQYEGEEVVALVDMMPDDFETRLLAAGKDIPEPLRKALQKMRELRGAIYTVEQRIFALEQERAQIFADQERLRENLKTVSPNTAVGKRYMKSLDDQESRLAALAKEEQANRAAYEKARQELQNYVATLDF